MSHTDPDALVADYLTADGALERNWIELQLATETDEQLADRLISDWELALHPDDEPSWLERHAGRDDLIAAIAQFRENFR